MAELAKEAEDGWETTGTGGTGGSVGSNNDIETVTDTSSGSSPFTLVVTTNKSENK